jgi:ADP-L-glycero-D-manno-heptose 6-epimerase
MGAIISQVTGTRPPEVIPFPSDLRGQYQAFTSADISRLRAAGYAAAFMTLEEGIAAYWKAVG